MTLVGWRSSVTAYVTTLLKKDNTDVIVPYYGVIQENLACLYEIHVSRCETLTGDVMIVNTGTNKPDPVTEV